MPLPCLLGGWLFRFVELEEARLGAGIEIDFQRAVVLPRDVQPPGLPHDAADTEGLTLVPGLVVLCQIPHVRDPSSLRAERNTRVVAFLGSDHPPAPVLGDNGHPVSRRVKRGGRPGRSSRRLRRLLCGNAGIFRHEGRQEEHRQQNARRACQFVTESSQKRLCDLSSVIRLRFITSFD